MKFHIFNPCREAELEKKLDYVTNLVNDLKKENFKQDTYIDYLKAKIDSLEGNKTNKQEMKKQPAVAKPKPNPNKNLAPIA